MCYLCLRIKKLSTRACRKPYIPTGALLDTWNYKQSDWHRFRPVCTHRSPCTVPDSGMEVGGGWNAVRDPAKVILFCILTSLLSVSSRYAWNNLIQRNVAWFCYLCLRIEQLSVITLPVMGFTIDTGVVIFATVWTRMCPFRFAVAHHREHVSRHGVVEGGGVVGSWGRSLGQSGVQLFKRESETYFCIERLFL